MLDPKLIRNNLEEVAAQLKRRGFVLDTAKIEQLRATARQFRYVPKNCRLNATAIRRP